MIALDATSLGIAAVALALGYWLGRWRARAESRTAERERMHLSEVVEQQQSRLRQAHETSEQLRRTLLHIPDVAQRLTSVKTLREIPEHALDLVEELLAPRYAVFFRKGNEDLVVVGARGDTDLEIGARVRMGEGVVGFAAVRQVAFTAEDAEALPPRVREEHLSRGWPKAGFSVALPLTEGERVLGVLLVGPTREPNTQIRELGRTIALAASVAITRTAALNHQRLLAQTDGLTRLLNKTHVLGQLREALAADRRRRRPVSVFLFDIDHFKNYNDTNGHLPGDELLRELAKLLRRHVRENEFVGRYGGEEFLLVMPDAGKEHALGAANRIRRLIQDHPFPHRENQPGGRVTISGGVATWPGDADDPASLVKHADEALYESKRAGRNRVTAWTVPDLDEGNPRNFLAVEEGGVDLGTEPSGQASGDEDAPAEVELGPALDPDAPRPEPPGDDLPADPRTEPEDVPPERD
jgi:diguanylate cyclase (GGDEF)-like protein